MNRGLLIALEGVGGTGRRLQAQFLHKALSNSTILYFPTVPKDFVPKDSGNRVEKYLSGAVIVQHKAQEPSGFLPRCDSWNYIRWLVSCGVHVIAEPYYAYAIAYRLACGANYHYLTSEEGLPKPDITFYLQQVQVGASKPHRKTLEGYYEQSFDHSWMSINANLPDPVIEAQMMKAVKKLTNRPLLLSLPLKTW